MKRLAIAGALLTALAFGLFIYLHRSVDIESTPLILGHGGMGVRSSYPLNSVKSVSKALSYQIAGTELDVKMSSDGALIAFHDSELSDNTSCNGCVAASSASDLVKCEYSSLFHSEYIGTVRSILNLDHPSGTVFSLDLKPDSLIIGDAEIGFGMALVRLTQDYPQYDFLIESQDAEFLASLKLEKARAKFFYYGHNPAAATQTVLNHGLDGISVNMNNISELDIRSVQNQGFKVMIWGCGSVLSNRQALQMQPDIIQTDAIPSMMRILRRN